MTITTCIKKSQRNNLTMHLKALDQKDGSITKGNRCQEMICLLLNT